jgi:hypothetical protein
MNDVYEINVAKARLRDAYNAGNVDLLLMAFADEFTDMSFRKAKLLWRRCEVCISNAHDEPF